MAQLLSLLNAVPSLAEVAAVLRQRVGPTGSLANQPARSSQRDGCEAGRGARAGNWRGGGSLVAAQPTGHTANQLMEETDFNFLLDPERKVFTVGYNVSAQVADNSYYDLLASEARLASFVAIAKGDVQRSSGSVGSSTD